VTTVSPGFADALRDRYVLERELGRGGMATVYLARDVRHDRPVALKVLHPELAHAVGPDRFIREIKLAARLQHPNILPVHDSGEAAGLLWYTMPFVAGESLRQRLTREAQLPVPDTVRITRELAEALGYAHRHGVVHRDVKPENILLDGERCLLADFGVARALDAAGERLTETGFALGTPAYMSPEQAAADRHLDARSDVYSLGCVVYEMLAGQPPFTGRTAQAVIARRLADPVPDLCTVRDVPRPLERVVRRALARAPADRFPDAPEFARALAATAGATAPSSSERRGPVVPAIVAALAAAAIATGLYLRLRPEAEIARDPNLLAVAPFDVLDPSLQIWREGIGDILSRTLDGAGPIRTVSPTVVHRRWSGRADRPSALALAHRTGAGLILYGAVTHRGSDSVALRGSLLDAAAEAVSDIEVSGDVTRIDELADSLGIRVLRELSRGRPIGSLRQVSIGARSLPALKAFLQGEQFYRRGLWDSALTRYDQAIGADSTFALALQRMDYVLGWNSPTAGAYRPLGEYTRQAIRYNHGLPPKESLLIAADSFRIAADSATDADELARFTFRSMGALEEAARRFPAHPETWFVLGESRLHGPWPVGKPPQATLEAFTRAIALDSGFASAYEHIPSLLLQLGRSDEALRYSNRYLALDSASPSLSESRLEALLLDTSEAARAEAARHLDTASVQPVWGVVFNGLIWWPDTAETAIRVTRRLGDPGRGAGGSAPFVLDSLMWPQYVAYALAFRGHLREAFAVDERLLRDPAASAWSYFLDPFLDLSLLGVIPDSLARVTFEGSLTDAKDWGGEFVPRQLQGLPWWLAHRDTSSLARFGALAAHAKRRPATPIQHLRMRLLGETSAGYLALARGDSAQAIRKLSAIPDTLCLADNFASMCLHRTLTLARLLAGRGEDRRAGELLEHWRWSAGATPAFVLATLELGRIAEHLGEQRKAAEYYGLVTSIWRRPDRELLPYVAEAREGLARLTTR
jgi:serine/threonine-protein kinase